jgi:hypothetical protein
VMLFRSKFVAFLATSAGKDLLTRKLA